VFWKRARTAGREVSPLGRTPSRSSVMNFTSINTSVYEHTRDRVAGSLPTEVEAELMREAGTAALTKTMDTSWPCVSISFPL